MCKFKLIQITILFCCLNFQFVKVYSQNFKASQSIEGIEISERGKKVLFYQQRPKSLDGKYARGGYVHPLYSLSENILTEDFPEDHPYHHGIFWAWHQILANEKSIADGWVYDNIFWKPGKMKVKTKRKYATIHSEMVWSSKLEGNKPTDIIKEATTITIHKSTEKYRVIDFDIRISTLVDSLKLGGSDDPKGYGGSFLRLKLPTDILFVSNDSIVTPQETAVAVGPWMDFTGSFDGSSMGKTGVAVFCDQPLTLNQPWILRREKSMQNVPYPGRTPILLSKEGWRLKYRMVIHNGLSKDELAELYHQYIHKS